MYLCKYRLLPCRDQVMSVSRHHHLVDPITSSSRRHTKLLSVKWQGDQPYSFLACKHHLYTNCCVLHSCITRAKTIILSHVGAWVRAYVIMHIYIYIYIYIHIHIFACICENTFLSARIEMRSYMHACFFWTNQKQVHVKYMYHERNSARAYVLTRWYGETYDIMCLHVLSHISVCMYLFCVMHLCLHMYVLCACLCICVWVRVKGCCISCAYACGCPGIQNLCTEWVCIRGHVFACACVYCCSCKHLCASACTCVCMCVCVYLCMCVCVYVFRYVCEYVLMFVCVCSCMCVCVYVLIFFSLCVESCGTSRWVRCLIIVMYFAHTYIHPSAHARTHAHTRTHTQTWIH